MSKNPYAPQFEDLPQNLPIFPLGGVLLMPHGQLPLNIFEPRYITMIEDALSSHRMIGMIQPKDSDCDNAQNSCSLYETGCAGKITEFSETKDGRYLITLTGICRFKMTQQLETLSPYRLVEADWHSFEGDLANKSCLGVDRMKLQALLESYFTKEGMSCDFNKFEGVDDGKLMTCLAMVCPFEANEKQALLEEVCCVERSKLFITMLEMAIQSGKPLDKSKTQCH